MIWQKTLMLLRIFGVSLICRIRLHHRVTLLLKYLYGCNFIDNLLFLLCSWGIHLMYFALVNARDACHLVILLVLVLRLSFQDFCILSWFMTIHANYKCVIVFIICLVLCLKTCVAETISLQIWMPIKSIEIFIASGTSLFCSHWLLCYFVRYLLMIIFEISRLIYNKNCLKF